MFMCFCLCLPTTWYVSDTNPCLSRFVVACLTFFSWFWTFFLLISVIFDLLFLPEMFLAQIQIHTALRLLIYLFSMFWHFFFDLFCPWHCHVSNILPALSFTLQCNDCPYTSVVLPPTTRKVACLGLSWAI